MGYNEITVLDLGSTYEPLLKYYKDESIKVIYHKGNHKSLWTDGIIKQFKGQYVCVSDSDIELNPNTPKGFLEELVVIAKDFRVPKVGLAIEYKDITNPVLKDIITPIESIYWKNRLEHPHRICFWSPLDTTLCVIDKDKPFQYPAIRVADWPIIHKDWYSSWEDLSEEEIFYMSHADEKIATTVSHYNIWKANQ